MSLNNLSKFMCSDVAKELQNYSSIEQMFLTIWDNFLICFGSETCCRQDLNQINVKLAQELSTGHFFFPGLATLSSYLTL